MPALAVGAAAVTGKALLSKAGMVVAKRALVTRFSQIGQALSKATGLKIPPILANKGAAAVLKSL